MLNTITNKITATVHLPKKTDVREISWSGDVEGLDSASARYYKHMNRLNLIPGKDPSGNRKKIEYGYCAQVASLEAATALGLMISDARSLKIFKSGGALISNAATTFGEYLQVLIAGNTAIGKKSENLIQVVVGAGGAIGFGKFLYDIGRYFTGNESEQTELTVAEKSVYTLGSLANAFFMFCNSAEKQLIEVLGKNDIGDEERDGVGADGRSDFRCFIEWASMIPYMWFKSFKPLKFLADGALPLMSLVDTVGHFTKVDYLKDFLAPNMLSSRIFFGSDKKPGGIRERVITPLLRSVYGLNSPKVYIKSNGDIEATFEDGLDHGIPSSIERQVASVPNPESSKLHRSAM